MYTRKAARMPQAAASTQGEARTVDGLMMSGLTELALGAVAGWPYSFAVADPERAKRMGIRSTARLRQWHLDLIMLGSLSILASTALPDLPRKVALPLAVGCWTNAMSFGALVIRPRAATHPAYKTAVACSFITTSTAFVGLAREGRRRRRGTPGC